VESIEDSIGQAVSTLAVHGFLLDELERMSWPAIELLLERLVEKHGGGDSRGRREGNTRVNPRFQDQENSVSSRVSQPIGHRQGDMSVEAMEPGAFMKGFGLGKP